MIFILSFLLLLPVTWLFYLAVMHLSSAKRQGRLTTASKIIGYPMLAVGLLVDALFNAVWGSALFLELPREWLFTARVSRWNGDSGWRGSVARWVCTQLLDPFDPDGTHCK